MKSTAVETIEIGRKISKSVDFFFASSDLDNVSE